jgi:hypothetical protein
MRVLTLLGAGGLILGVVAGGCAAARVTSECDGSLCGQSDAGCEGDACVVCPDPATCNAEALCTEALCGGRSFVCSLDGPGHYGWTTTMANCDDGDPCTDNDHCIGQVCTGTSKSCSSPPGATCVGTGTLRSYSLPGQCVDGTCEYDYTDRTCAANDCAGGTCSGDPCAGITCNTPGDPCLESTGTCSNGTCTYPPKSLDCTRPHATGGHCVGGVCAGWTCDSGYADCNTDWSDGCEISLKTAQHCGACNTPCTVGAHATASCSTGTCTRTCTAPWQNCDNDWANGCEIPAGVANQCNDTGLNTSTACGTAYCGTGSGSNAHNFGTWYCKYCSTCHEVAAGSAWCLWSVNGGTGNWSTATPSCSSCCGSYEDTVCAP